MFFRILILFTFFNTQYLIIAQSLFYETNDGLELSNTIVANIDTISITAEEFFYSYEFGPSFPKRQKKSKEVHLNYMINEKLLALEAYKSGILNEKNVVNIFSEFYADLATEELFKNEILSKVKIKDYELNYVVKDKLTEIELRWIYSPDKKSINNTLLLLNDKTLFDSLFLNQLNDTVFADQREMKISMFNLKKNNKTLANIIDSLNIGDISVPIQKAVGWYIIKYDNKIVSLINNESERNKFLKEAIEALTVHKMDSISDNYVNNILFENKPIIKRDAFNILRSYLSKYLLSEAKYNEWKLDEKMESSLNKIGLSKNDNFSELLLVESEVIEVKLKDFLTWYYNRESYIKLDKLGLPEFSKSLENTIWQMVRDELLTMIAKEKKYFENEWVKSQSNWWKDKIVYSALRNEYANSMTLDNSEIKDLESDESRTEIMEMELSKKMMLKVLELRKHYNIKINKNVLDRIIVSSEEDKHAIDLYTIKKGSLIKRPAYPSIDSDWSNWQ